MAYSARIDELEKKFSENARRYFAPLANEYRKAGDLDRAIEICRAHLPQQPGHMSGHIVYGQALYESRQLDEAKTVFEAALALDPENLIALRHLGDIARDNSDPATARSWYMRVLDADPRNEDVAAMVAELEATQAAAPADGASEGASGWGDINPERAAGEGDDPGGKPGAKAKAEPEDTFRIEPEPDQSSTIGLEPMPGDASVDEVVRPGAQPAPSAGEQRDQVSRGPGGQQPSLDRMLDEAFASEADTQEMEASSVASAAFASPESAKGVIATKGQSEKGAEAERDDRAALGEGALAEVDALFDEIASESGAAPAVGSSKGATIPGSKAASTAGMRDHSAEPAGGDELFADTADESASTSSGQTTGRLDGLETSEFVAPSRAPVEPAPPTRTTGSMSVSGLTSFEQPSEEDSSARAAFVTETMAELYLQQGFTAEALEIYRKLLQQNPADTSLRDRIAQLEQGGPTSLSVAAVSSDVIQAARQRHAARPVRTARSFFGRLAGQHVAAPSEENEERGGEERAAGDREDDGNATGADGFGGAYRASEPERAPRMTTAGATAPAPSTSERRPTGRGIPVVSDLFGDIAVSEADEAAASMLASAFSGFAEAPANQPGSSSPSSPAAGTVKAGGTAGRPARAAGRELSLDQVFRDSQNRQPRKSGPFSFDQFFSDVSQDAPAEAPPPDESEGSQEQQDPGGDLEQFTAWLEGLKRK